MLGNTAEKSIALRTNTGSSRSCQSRLAAGISTFSLSAKTLRLGIEYRFVKELPASSDSMGYCYGLVRHMKSYTAVIVSDNAGFGFNKSCSEHLPEIGL